MAKAKKYYGVNGAKAVLKNLKHVMRATGQKYSIKVGIIGNEAYQKHEGSGLTNAELGAVHEFGATINVTPKMRAFLHHIGVHLKKDTTRIVIPTRSFLRRVLFDKKIQEYTRMVKDTEVSIAEYDIKDSSENRWVVFWVYQDVQYTLNITNLKQLEVEKIVDNLKLYD